MQVNGWVVGIGAAIALGSVAQAQIAVPPPTGAEIAALKAQVAALQNTVTVLQNNSKNNYITLMEVKGDVKTLKSDLAKNKSDDLKFNQMFTSHTHFLKTGTNMTDVAWCGNFGCNMAAVIPK